MSLTVSLRDVVREHDTGGHVVRALNRLTLELNGGQFTSIVGPSGAGKSTLLHLLGALDTPDSGSVRIDGVDVGEMDDDEQSTFRRNHVGFVFQFFNLLPTLTAWENVAIPAVLDGGSLRKVRRTAVELLEQVGLGDRLDHRPAELSGGQMQRVAVARALVMNPRLILADEPTGNLDSTTGAAILKLLHDVAHDSGGDRAVVMVTHDLDAANRTDRVVTLQDGKVKSDVLRRRTGGVGQRRIDQRRADHPRTEARRAEARRTDARDTEPPTTGARDTGRRRAEPRRIEPREAGQRRTGQGKSGRVVAHDPATDVFPATHDPRLAAGAVDRGGRHRL